jgi:hypothetical protein
MFLNQSMMLGELREIASIAIESVVKELQRATGVGNGITKKQHRSK